MAGDANDEAAAGQRAAPASSTEAEKVKMPPPPAEPQLDPDWETLLIRSKKPDEEQLTKG